MRTDGMFYQTQEICPNIVKERNINPESSVLKNLNYIGETKTKPIKGRLTLKEWFTPKNNFALNVPNAHPSPRNAFLHEFQAYF